MWCLKEPSSINILKGRQKLQNSSLLPCTASCHAVNLISSKNSWFVIKLLLASKILCSLQTCRWTQTWLLRRLNKQLVHQLEAVHGQQVIPKGKFRFKLSVHGRQPSDLELRNSMTSTKLQGYKYSYCRKGFNSTLPDRLIATNADHYSSESVCCHRTITTV